MGIQKVTDMGKKVKFRASYTEMGPKLIIIIPKNFHKDFKKMNKIIDVIAEEVE